MKRLNILLLLFLLALREPCSAGYTNDITFSLNRIPVLDVAPNGHLLAFYEHRITITNFDQGHIDVVLTRSPDNGTNWLPVQNIFADGTNAFSCGTSIVDRTTGVIFFLAAWSPFADSEEGLDNGTASDIRRIFVSSSSDNGTNWTKPLDISNSVRSNNFAWYDPGPSKGIQLTSGRLLVPFYHSVGTNYFPNSVYSDDHGVSWVLGGSITNQGNYTNGGAIATSGYTENSYVELTNGTVMMFARNESAGYVGIATSIDGGNSWSAITNSNTLMDSTCENSSLRYTKPQEFGKARLLFCNPPSSIPFDRNNVTVRLSYDEGRTWPVAKQYFSGPSAYSSMAILPNGDWAMLVENGDSSYFDRMSFISDSLSNLTGGADSLDPQLSIVPSGTNLLVSWASIATEFALQQTGSLSPGQWSNTIELGPIVATNQVNRLLISPTNASRFFRIAIP